MRRLERVYVVASCMVTAVLLGGVVFFVAAAWIVPDWTRGVGREASVAIALISGLPGTATTNDEPSSRGTELSHEYPARPSHEDPPRSVAARGPEVTSPLAKVTPVVARTAQGGVGGLESAVRVIESDLDALRSARTRTPGGWREHPGVAEARLQAWERIRGPLFLLLGAIPVDAGAEDLAASRSPVASRPARSLPDEQSDIRLIAEELAARLSLLVRMATCRRPGIVERLDPHTLVHILLEEESLSDAEALDVLSRFSHVQAVDVLDRLSRLDPERAGTLLRGLVSLSDRLGIGGWTGMEAAARTGGRPDREVATREGATANADIGGPGTPRRPGATPSQEPGSSRLP